MPKPVRIGDTYYLRVHVPRDVVQKVRGTKVTIPVAGSMKSVLAGDILKVSLGTKDSKEAKVRFTSAIVGLETWWAAVRTGPLPLSHKQSLAIAGAIRKIWIDVLDEDPGPPETSEEVLTANRKAAEGPYHSLAVGTQKPSAKGLEARFGGLVDAFLRSNGRIVDGGSRSRLLEHVAQAMNEAATVNKAKALGDYSDSGETSKYPVLEPHEPPQPDCPKDATQVTIQEIIDRRIREMQVGKDATPMRPKTVGKYRLAAQEFSAFRGSDVVQTLRAEEVERWKQAMLEAAHLGNKTIGQRLQSLRTVIEFGRKQGLGALFPKGNPVALVEMPRFSTVPSHMRTFTLREARQILTAARCELRPELRWLPWLCAYSGARINELSPLTPTDFVEVEGDWFFQITTAGGKEKKNRFSERRIPVHPDLMSEGLIEYVSGRAASLPSRMFPVRSEQNIANWMRKTVGITRDHLRPNHGWRHLFEDMAVRAGMSEAAKKYITGRSTGASEESYGNSDALLPGLAAEMRKVHSYL